MALLNKSKDKYIMNLLNTVEYHFPVKSIDCRAECQIIKLYECSR